MASVVRTASVGSGFWCVCSLADGSNTCCVITITSAAAHSVAVIPTHCRHLSFPECRWRVCSSAVVYGSASHSSASWIFTTTAFKPWHVSFPRLSSGIPSACAVVPLCRSPQCPVSRASVKRSATNDADSSNHNAWILVTHEIVTADAEGDHCLRDWRIVGNNHRWSAACNCHNFSCNKTATATTTTRLLLVFLIILTTLRVGSSVMDKGWDTHTDTEPQHIPC